MLGHQIDEALRKPFHYITNGKNGARDTLQVKGRETVQIFLQSCREHLLETNQDTIRLFSSVLTELSAAGIFPS